MTFKRLCRTVLHKKKTSLCIREIQKDLGLNKLESPANVETGLDSILQKSVGMSKQLIDLGSFISRC